MAGNPDPRRGGTVGRSSPGGTKRQSPAVYRRRRLAVLLALLLLAGLVFGGIALVRALTSGGDAETAGAAPSAGPSASGSPPPAPETTPGAGQENAQPQQTGEADGADSGEPERNECPAGVVRVEAGTDSPVYAAGTSPLLTLSVTNTGSEACDINVGTNRMEFLVTSGSDRIFSSVDCQEPGEDLWKSFEPGATESAVLPWDRVRSAPGCAPVPGNPAPGTYVFTAALGALTSEQSVFQLE